MKTCLRLTLFICLTLPMFAAAQSVQVPNSCGEGKAFTIRIPVKLQGMSVEYVWYRNDTVVAEAPMTAGVTAISYTIPANKAFGSSVVYHFKYRLNDDFHEWTASRKYAITFVPSVGCSLEGADSIECDNVSLSCQMSSGGSIECDDVSLSCQMSSGGSIECDDVSLSCQMSSGGSIECDDVVLNCQMSGGGGITTD